MASKERVPGTEGLTEFFQDGGVVPEGYDTLIGELEVPAIPCGLWIHWLRPRS